MPKATKHSRTPPSLDYSTLYGHPEFDEMFPNHISLNRKSAEYLWSRVISRCGFDPDLPGIEWVVDYGCGQGHFALRLAELAHAEGVNLRVLGIDCSETVIEEASKLAGEAEDIRFSQCAEDPLSVLPKIKVPWERTALLVMGHTWFHLDQERLAQAITNLHPRPALLIVDVHSNWDFNVEEIRSSKTHDGILDFGKRLVSGRPAWLKTVPSERPRMVYRGLWTRLPDGSEDWVFRTEQHALTTVEVFGGLPETELNNPRQILETARNRGMLASPKSPELCYVRVRFLHHNSPWGPMDCLILVARDEIAGLCNDCHFEIVRSLIGDLMEKKGGAMQPKGQQDLFELFDGDDGENPVSGSREALVVMPYDPNFTFAKAVPLFDCLPKEISNHPLLVEHPTRTQTHFPSANGVFQTCLAKSSSPQAFPTAWAPDYRPTPVDLAFEHLEQVVLGLNTEGMNIGRWRLENESPSYFLLPVYFGSLPLFCLALKFPKTFKPEVTSFDVYYSTIKSLHDRIQNLLTEEVVRERLIRPWLEAVLAGWRNRCPSEPDASDELHDKLERIEELLAGHRAESSELPRHGDWILRGEVRRGGVLGKEWKSWVLGLPSMPINRIESVTATNTRLLAMWDEEKRLVALDPVLRISQWFEVEGFFDSEPGADAAHDSWFCRHHLQRLHRMFLRLRIPVEPMEHATDDAWIEDAWIEDAVERLANKEAGVEDYFGRTTTGHFLFSWLVSKLRELPALKQGCAYRSNCARPGNPVACPRNKDFYQVLKSVFCKSRSNRGAGVRFTSTRLYWLLFAACGERVLVNGKGDALPPLFPRKGSFWAANDPSTPLAELVASLAREGLLEEVHLFYQGKPTDPERVFQIAIRLKGKLSCQAGGEKCESILLHFHTCSQLLRREGAAAEDFFGTEVLSFAFKVITITPVENFHPIK
jgi:SAM-dependent methyltransferase